MGEGPGLDTAHSPAFSIHAKSFGDWIAHKLARKEAERHRAEKQIAQRESEIETTPVPVRLCFGGKKFEADNVGPVLGRETIWRPSTAPIPGLPQAPWPSHEEFKHEGDDRSKSNYSRFPPLPRDPGNETVNWKQRRPLMQRTFDQVGVPTMTANASTSEQIGEEANEYLNESLREALDP